MPCLTAPITDNGQLLIVAWVSDAATVNVVADVAHPGNSEVEPCSALLDTGANASCISERCAQKLGLIVRGKKNITSVSHSEVPLNEYRINIQIPFGGPVHHQDAQAVQNVVVFNIQNLLVAGMPGVNPDFDLLLGMDIIAPGSLHVSGDRFTFCL